MNVKNYAYGTLLTCSLLANALAYSLPVNVVHAGEPTWPPIPAAPLPPTYTRQNDDCDMKYGLEHTGEGAARYMQEIMKGVIADYNEPIQTADGEQPRSHIDYNNDFLCWVPDAMQLTLIGRAEDLVYFTGETMPRSSWRTQLDPAQRREYRP